MGPIILRFYVLFLALNNDDLREHSSQVQNHSGTPPILISHLHEDWEPTYATSLEPQSREKQSKLVFPFLSVSDLIKKRLNVTLYFEFSHFGYKWFPYLLVAIVSETAMQVSHSPASPLSSIEIRLHAGYSGRTGKYALRSRQEGSLSP